MKKLVDLQFLFVSFQFSSIGYDIGLLFKSNISMIPIINFRFVLFEFRTVYVDSSSVV